MMSEKYCLTDFLVCGPMFKKVSLGCNYQLYFDNYFNSASFLHHFREESVSVMKRKLEIVWEI